MKDRLVRTRGNNPGTLVTFNAWLVAIMLCINSLAVITPINGIVVVGCFICFLFLLFFNSKRIGSKLYIKSYLVVLVTIVAFALDIFFNKEEIIKEYFYSFLCFGMPFLFLPFADVNYRNVIRNVCYLGVLFLPFYVLNVLNIGMMDVTHYNDDSLNTMTMSYRLLPYICASIFLLLEGDTKKKIVALMVGVPYSIIFFVIGSRGAIVAALLLPL